MEVRFNEPTPNEAVDEEYDNFLFNVDSIDFHMEITNYFDEDDYNDEYSKKYIHNKLWVAFEQRVRKYLHENYPNKFAVYNDWCVHVVPIFVAKSLGWKDEKIEHWIVK